MAALRSREPEIELAAPFDVTLTDGDGQGSCAAFSRGLMRAASARYGAIVTTETAAAKLLIRNGSSPGRLGGSSQRVCGVVTESGEEIEADAVVLCAGACVAPLAASAGVYIPVQPLRGYSLTARVVEGAEAHASKAQTEEQTRALEEARSLFGLVALLPPPKRSVLTHLTLAPSSLYVTRLGDELRFTCYGEFCPVRADGTGPPNEELQAALRELVEAEVPNVRELCIWDHAVPWCGARPLTPDCYPISGKTPVPGLFVNAGHSFNGWREATLSARVLADAVGGRTGGETDAPEVATRACDPARFALWR